MQPRKQHEKTKTPRRQVSLWRQHRVQGLISMPMPWNGYIPIKCGILYRWQWLIIRKVHWSVSDRKFIKWINWCSFLLKPFPRGNWLFFFCFLPTCWCLCFLSMSCALLPLRSFGHRVLPFLQCVTTSQDILDNIFISKKQLQETGLNYLFITDSTLSDNKFH